MSGSPTSSSQAGVNPYLAAATAYPAASPAQQHPSAYGPSYQAGLRPGDVIVRFDGQVISGIDDLHRALNRARVGDEVTLGVLRGTELLEITTPLVGAGA